jgi:adenylylsulfate kinase-like enzyme
MANRGFVLDGDEFRSHLGDELGFPKQHRDTNLRRIGYLAHLLSRHGVVIDRASQASAVRFALAQRLVWAGQMPSAKYKNAKCKMQNAECKMKEDGNDTSNQGAN